jgi:Xaa-Pro aminopeptidase
VDAETLQNSLKEKESHLISITENLVDQVWEDRPKRPANEVFPLDVKYSGKTYPISFRSSLLKRSTLGEPHTEKIKRLREELKSKNFKAMVVNMLDEVAWLFNLRGSDIDFNPVFFAYAVVTQDKALLFVNPSQVSDAIRKHLGEGIEIRAYDDFFQYLSGLGAELELSKKAVCTPLYVKSTWVWYLQCVTASYPRRQDQLSDC